MTNFKTPTRPLKYQGQINYPQRVRNLAQKIYPAARAAESVMRNLAPKPSQQPVQQPVRKPSVKIRYEKVFVPLKKKKRKYGEKGGLIGPPEQ